MFWVFFVFTARVYNPCLILNLLTCIHFLYFWCYVSIYFPCYVNLSSIYLYHLFKFIAGGDIEDEDVTLMPVKLPLEFKAEPEVKSEDYTKVKIKSEPMETDDITDSVKYETEKKDDILKNKPAERLISCSELFTNPVKSGTWLNDYLMKFFYKHNFISVEFDENCRK